MVEVENRKCGFGMVAAQLAVLAAYRAFRHEPGGCPVVGWEKIWARDGRLNISCYVAPQRPFAGPEKRGEALTLPGPSVTGWKVSDRSGGRLGSCAT
jgi:hypothetical protein